MTSRRKTLLLVLVALVLLPVLIGALGLMVGPVELALLALLLVVWLAVFLTWGGRTASTGP